MVDAPDWVNGQALDHTSSSIDRVKFDAEDQGQLGVVGFDVNAAANCTENIRSDLYSFGDLNKVDIGEVEGSMLSVWLDDDWDLDLTLKLVQLGRVLRLGQSEFVASDPVNNKTMLGEDVLRFSSFAKVVVAKMNAARVDRHTA